MKIQHAITALAVMLSVNVLATSTLAQYDPNAQQLRQSAISLYRTCTASAGESGATNLICACSVGYIGATMTDRQLDIAARLATIGIMSENGTPEAQVLAAITEYFNAGYTIEDGDEVTSIMESASNRGDAICAAFQDNYSI